MDSDSELQARRSLSHEEDDIDDRDEAQADIDNEDNDSMLRPQDSLLEDGTGSEYACSPVGPVAGALGGVVGIRAHHAGLGGLRVNNDVIDEDDDTKDEQSSIMLALTEQNSPISNISSSHRSRNKRKNFKPRNIIYDQASEQLQLQQTAAASLLPSISKKLHLMPQARDNNGPMDLSVQGTNGNDMLDDGIDDLEDEEDAASSDLPPPPEPMTSAASLSVVRPEVLFGGQKEGLMGSPLAGSGLPPGMPPFLAPFLAASAVPSSGAGGPSMKDAFQEVLKLFGFPPELAEVFAKNAQALQQQHKDPSSNPAGLSAAAAAAAAASAAMSQQQQAGGQDQGNYMFNYS